ncbi:MAG: serine protease, partial [Symploca sp. SIO3E6]|nr:serine protease [Caldora sp. SIO3E6]
VREFRRGLCRSDSLSGGNIGIGFAIAIDRVLPFLADVQARRAPRTAVRRAASSGKLRPQPLVLNGSLLTGRLDQSSNVLPFDNSFFDLYIFEGRAGQRVQIEMISEQINPYLILLNSQGQEIAQDNDSGGAANSRIVVTLPVDGVYLLMANAYEAGQAGSYRLRAEVTAASVGNSSNGNNFILQQVGILSSRDAALPTDGSLFKAYSFEGRAGQSVIIDLASPDFDPFLAVLDPDGRIIAQNDDISQTDNNSQLTLTLARTGVYQVIVNAFDSDGRGRYILTIR